ncbi:GNAT family N-acetyltransferase [Erwinia billingiae]|uniref:GNAT family N-acetyltransferase n=1 Tax=Erwinia billingiae TaxID=182337 RepID=UPI00069FFDBF|nr:GNAT family protein [Erwinia billingiae]
MNINQYGQQVGVALPDWQPARPFPRNPLTGQYCTLEPLDPQHSAALFRAFSLAEDDRDWTWLGALKPASLSEMIAWVTHKCLDQGLVSYAVVDNSTRQAVGAVCFANIDAVNGACEIGHVTWSPLMKRTVFGTEALFLLLTQAFSLGYRRVAWRCDSTNLASRRAAERIGFTFEGCFRQAMTRKQRNRDTDWLSIIDGEWPAIDAALSGWLSPANFTADGQQRLPLSAFIKNG